LLLLLLLLLLFVSFFSFDSINQEEVAATPRPFPDSDAQHVAVLLQE